jgi:hypothetical protein
VRGLVSGNLVAIKASASVPILSKSYPKSRKNAKRKRLGRVASLENIEKN